VLNVWLQITLASAQSSQLCHVLTVVVAVRICHPQSGPMSSSPINSTSFAKNHLCWVSTWLLGLLSQMRYVLFEHLKIDLLGVYLLVELGGEDGIPEDLLLSRIELHGQLVGKDSVGCRC
jgi:hypothetical protein